MCQRIAFVIMGLLFLAPARGTDFSLTGVPDTLSPIYPEVDSLVMDSTVMDTSTFDRLLMDAFASDSFVMDSSAFGILPMDFFTADSSSMDSSAMDSTFFGSFASISAEDTRQMLREMVLSTYYEKIERLLLAGDCQNALAVSDSTLKLCETSQNYYYQGLVNECLSNWYQAEWAYSKAIKLDSLYLSCYIPMIRVLLILNRPEEAILWSDRIFELNPSESETLLYRSRAFAMVNDYKEAIEDVSLAISIDTLWADAYRLRALYYIEDKQPLEAADDYSKLIEWEDQNPEWYILRADCYEQLERTENAVKDYLKVTSLTVNNPSLAGLYREAENRLQALIPVVSAIEKTDEPPLSTKKEEDLK